MIMPCCFVLRTMITRCALVILHGFTSAHRALNECRTCTARKSACPEFAQQTTTPQPAAAIYKTKGMLKQALDFSLYIFDLLRTLVQRIRTVYQVEGRNALHIIRTE